MSPRRAVRGRRLLPLLPVALPVVLLDQLSKLLVLETLGRGQGQQRVDLVGSWLAIEYAENRGAAFGILQRQSGLVPVVAAAALATVLLVYLRSGNRSTTGIVGAGLVVGGAIGNLIDRVRLGFVVDFVAVGPWPNFNVADSAITLGAALLLLGAATGGRERRGGAAPAPIVERPERG